MKIECVGQIVRAISFQDFLPNSVLIHQRYRQTDRRTTCNLNTALCTKVHRAVKINRCKLAHSVFTSICLIYYVQCTTKSFIKKMTEHINITMM